MNEERCYSDLYLWGQATAVAANMDKLQDHILKVHSEASGLFLAPSAPVTARSPWPEQGVVEVLESRYDASKMPKNLIGSLLDLAAQSPGVLVVLLEWSDAEEALGASARIGLKNGETLVASKSLLEDALGMNWAAALQTMEFPGNRVMANKLLAVALAHPALLQVLTPVYAQARAARLEVAFSVTPSSKRVRF